MRPRLNGDLPVMSNLNNESKWLTEIVMTSKIRHELLSSVAMLASPMASNDSTSYDFQSEENAQKWKDLFKNALQKVSDPWAWAG